MNDLSNYSDEEIIGIVSADFGVELRKRGYEYGWYKKEKFVGAIYIFDNPAYSGLVKIGYADDVQKRLKYFNRNSGMPGSFHCYAVYRVKKGLQDLRLHNLIDTLNPNLRYDEGREFYRMDCQTAYDVLLAIAQINDSEELLIKNPFSDSYFETQITEIPENIESVQSEKAPKKNGNVQSKKVSKKIGNVQSKKAPKKENLKFSMINIPIGSTLVFVKDTNITCTTKDDDNKVEYNGSTYTITGLAKKLLNRKNGVRGSLHFMYNGEVLTDIRNRLGV